MKNRITLVTSSCVLMALLAMPVMAAISQDIPEDELDIKDIVGYIDELANWIFMILISVAVIMVLMAGFYWMTSGGDDEKVGTARKMLMWALVGVAIALLSKGLVFLVDNFITSRLR